MIDNYVLMYQDIQVGDLTYDTNTKEFNFIKYDEITHRKYLPLGMYIFVNWKIDYKPTNEDIVFWLKDRVVPNKRANIDKILKAMGIIDYDFWELCRRTRGMCMEDYFWLRKGEKYEEVHIRYLSEQNRIDDTPIPFKVQEYKVCKKYGISSSTLSTFKMQLAVINATEPVDYKSTAKEKALEEENRKLKELLGKKELELDMLQELIKKEIPEVADKVNLAKEYSKKGLKLARACKLLQVSRTSCYPKKKTENDDKKPSARSADLFLGIHMV